MRRRRFGARARSAERGFPEPRCRDRFEVAAHRVVGERHLKLRLRRGAQALDAMLFGSADPARRDVTRLERSGDPGIASEWVLRIPVGRPLELGPQPVATQDLFDREPRRVGLQSVREGDHEVLRPAGLRVTLLEACEADVRVGSITHLDFEPTAVVPFVRGFRRRWWAQADGCAGLLRPPARAEAAPVPPALAPPPAPEPPPRPAPEPSPTPKPVPASSFLRVSREPGTRFLSLRVAGRAAIAGFSPVVCGTVVCTIGVCTAVSAPQHPEQMAAT